MLHLNLQLVGLDAVNVFLSSIKFGEAGLSDKKLIAIFFGLCALCIPIDRAL